MSQIMSQNMHDVDLETSETNSLAPTTSDDFIFIDQSESTSLDTHLRSASCQTKSNDGETDDVDCQSDHDDSKQERLHDFAISPGTLLWGRTGTIKTRRANGIIDRSIHDYTQSRRSTSEDGIGDIAPAFEDDLQSSLPSILDQRPVIQESVPEDGSDAKSLKARKVLQAKPAIKALIPQTASEQWFNMLGDRALRFAVMGLFLSMLCYHLISQKAYVSLFSAITTQSSLPFSRHPLIDTADIAKNLIPNKTVAEEAVISRPTVTVTATVVSTKDRIMEMTSTLVLTVTKVKYTASPVAVTSRRSSHASVILANPQKGFPYQTKRTNNDFEPPNSKNHNNSTTGGSIIQHWAKGFARSISSSLPIPVRRAIRTGKRWHKKTMNTLLKAESIMAENLSRTSVKQFIFEQYRSFKLVYKTIAKYGQAHVKQISKILQLAIPTKSQKKQVPNRGRLTTDSAISKAFQTLTISISKYGVSPFHFLPNPFAWVASFKNDSSAYKNAKPHSTTVRSSVKATKTTIVVTTSIDTSDTKKGQFPADDSTPYQKNRSPFWVKIKQASDSAIHATANLIKNLKKSIATMAQLDYETQAFLDMGALFARAGAVLR